MGLYDYLHWKRRAMMMALDDRPWWQPDGMDPADCFAAYDFTQATEAEALLDLTGHNRHLNDNNIITDPTHYDPTHSPSGRSPNHIPGYGMYFCDSDGLTADKGYLSNAEVSRGNGYNAGDSSKKWIYSVVLRYRDAGGGASSMNLTLTSGSRHGIWFYHSETYPQYDGIRFAYGDWPADPDNPGLSLHRDVYANPQISGASGVVGFTGPVSIHSDTPAVDWAEISLYLNGEKRPVGNRGYGYESDVPRAVAVQKVFGSSTMGWMTGDYYFPAFTIVAAAFYSVRLTDAQHAQVAEGIAEL